VAVVVSAAGAAPRPTTALDVSVILDVSGSVAGPLEENLVWYQQQIRDLVQPGDRQELIAVDREIRRAADPHEWSVEKPPRIADGGTRLFDAMLTASLERVAADRRHVIVALTDGLDTGSLFDRPTRIAVLRRSQAVIDIVAISIGGRRSGFVSAVRGHSEIGDYDYLLREITDTTNGRFYDILPGQSVIDSLQGDLDRARHAGH
jgi:hypothetical protein